MKEKFPASLGVHPIDEDSARKGVDVILALGKEAQKVLQEICDKRCRENPNYPAILLAKQILETPASARLKRDLRKLIKELEKK